MKNATKSAIKEFWNKKPCGTFGSVPVNAGLSYFEAIKKRRYRLEPFILKFMDSLPLKGASVLEIGCGVGTDGLELVRRGASYAGIDASEESVALARKNFSLHGMVSNIEVGDAESLPFKDADFDVVYSWGVLHHTPDMKKAVAEVRRVLKPGGKFLIMLYSRNSLVGLQLYLFYGLLRFKPSQTLKELFASHHESPGTQALTDGETQKLFSAFDDVKIQNVVTPYDLRIARNIFLPGWFGIFVPSRLGFFKIIEEKNSFESD